MDIRLVDLSQRHVASIRTTVQARRFTRTIALMHELVMDAIGVQGLAPAGPLFARFHRSGEVVDVEAGVPLAQPITPVGVVMASSLPGGPALAVAIEGGDRDSARSRSRLVAQALSRGFGIRGAPWENYLVDERDTPVQAEWRRDIFLPVRKSPIHKRDRAVIRIEQGQLEGRPPHGSRANRVRPVS